MINFVTNIDINEAIWRNHYQIVVADKEDCNCSEPLFFGSAFRMCYRGKDWLITADHVIHPEKHGLIEIPEGQDIDSIEHNYFLINNYTTPSTAKEYFDYGVIKNEIVGFQFRRVNAPYGYLKYIEEKDNLYRFCYST